MSRLLYYNCSGNLTRTGRNVARIQIFTQDTSRAHVSDVGRLPSKGVTLTPPPFLRDRTTPHSDNRTPVSRPAPITLCPTLLRMYRYV